jgi:uncharacterized NAD-dependent epimerase/dehydratase family protein
MDGDAIVWCARAFAGTDGKTAHGLVRFTRRYRVAAVIDPDMAGKDALEALDGIRGGIPIVASLADALASARARGLSPRYFVIGVATLGGRLSPEAREAISEALREGLHVDSGLHEFASDDPELSRIAAERGVEIRDVRKTGPRARMRAFSGEISQVRALKLAVLGSDSAIGKRTTSWKLVEAYERAGARVAMVGTGQTAWMQGADASVCMDSLVNDFVAGELEGAVLRAWKAASPEVIVIEGQGSMMNPAFPGGFEILAATRPDGVVFQHAPKRSHYDLGLPELVPMHPLERQIAAVELISGKPVIAITLNHEGMSTREEIDAACLELSSASGRPAWDPLVHGLDGLARHADALFGRGTV